MRGLVPCTALADPPHFGLVYLLSLQMTARGVLFNRKLDLAVPPEVVSSYYMAEWACDFSSPLVS